MSACRSEITCINCTSKFPGVFLNQRIWDTKRELKLLVVLFFGLITAEKVSYNLFVITHPYIFVKSGRAVYFNTSQFTFLINYLCALNTTLRLLNTWYRLKVIDFILANMRISCNIGSLSNRIQVTKKTQFGQTW